MPNAAELLNYYFDIQLFVTTAGHLISPETERRIEESVNNLNKISTSTSTTTPPMQRRISINYREFMKLAPNGKEALETKFNTLRAARYLSYALTYAEAPHPPIILSQYLQLAITIIDTWWRPSMLITILNCLLKNWVNLHNRNGELLRGLISKRIRDYVGRNRLISKIRENSVFFLKSSGAALLGGETAGSKKKLTQARESLGFPEYMDNFEYFGEVAVAFTQTGVRMPDIDNFIEDIINFLRKHNRVNVSKQCLSKLILKIDSSNRQDFQDLVQSESMHLIGDPAIEAFWSPWEGASRDDRNELNKAQTILNEWITRQFIGLFFEKLTMDDDRRQFWLGYAKKINKFKIYTSWYNVNTLKRDERLRPYLNNRVGQLEGATSALVMVSGDYTMVEFSTTGHAFYAYKSSNHLCPNIDNTAVNLTDLKYPQDMKLLMKYSGNYVHSWQSEGRFRHTGYWQRRLAEWLKRYAGI